MPQSSTVRIASSVIPRVFPFRNSDPPISTGTNSSFSITPAALNSASVASMISGPIPSPAANAIRN
jgi:hypothetical protein